MKKERKIIMILSGDGLTADELGRAGKDDQTDQLHTPEKQRYRNSVQLLTERRSNQ